MAAPQRDTTIESALPVASANGLNTNQNINFNSGSNTCDLPASTTLNGLAISAQGNISGSNTTGASFSVTNSGIYTGVGADQIIGDSATSGVVALVSANGLTTGTAQSLTSTGTLVTTGAMLRVTANSATTAVGLVTVTGTSLTDGFGLQITSGGASLTATGGGINVLMGAATLGNGIKVSTTGVYTGTTGVLSATANSATTGSVAVISGTGLTSGKGLVINGTSATLTTGFYLACNDATGNVFTVGSNGHLTANLGGGTAPVMTTNATGISATVIVAGSTDVCGSFTTTGTPASGTVLTCTFHKTYTVAPKFVVVSPANAAAGGVNTMPIIATTATTFTMTWPAGGVYAATPSYMYFVIA